MRLFVSVDLPDELAGPVAALQDECRDADGLRFTDPEQAHVTLFFLGDVEADRVPSIVDGLEGAVEAAGVAPFEATFGGLGVFPELEYIRVLWLGVREGDGDGGDGDEDRGGDEDGGSTRDAPVGAAALTRLHGAVEPRMVDLGFEPEDHAFTPHVTLARMEHAGGKELVQRLVRHRDPTVGTATVSELRLTESTLGPDGPEYSTVERISLPDERHE